MLNNEKRNILIVDDIKSNLEILEDALKPEYSIALASDGFAALEYIKENIPDLVLLDIMMPKMDGYEICKKIKADKNTAKIPVIFITAMDEVENKRMGFNVGGVDYITKPFEILEVKARVKTHMDLKIASERLEEQNQFLELLVKERTKELDETRLEIVYRLGRAAEYRDNETGMHIRRMSHYCKLLGKALGLSEKECDILLHASAMHDVGKIGIPDRILLKPGKLDTDEFEIMKTHTTIGGEILSGHNSKELRMAHTIALSHHEKWDGSGYPLGLKGEAIPIEGRIAAISDVFDALVSIRPYKKAWTITEAITLIDESSGSHFDPNIVKLFHEIHGFIMEVRKRFPD